MAIKKNPLSKKSRPLKQQTTSQTNQSLIIFFFKSILTIMILALFCLSIYFIYLNIPGEPRRLDVTFPEVSVESTILQASFAKQFYPQMKFNHNNISYIIDSNCDEEKQKRMFRAFDSISMKVPMINFVRVGNNPDIEVSCSRGGKESLREDFFIAGEGGAKEIIQTGKYNVITEGIIFLYNENKNLQKCNWPNVEIHELMHVFGFNHSEDKKSIMYPYLEDCNQVLDLAIIKKLKALYSGENLADLYFEDVKVIKKGRYLDFNLTIKNAGLVNAENVSVSVLDEGKVIEDKDLGDINYGAGISLEISGLKLARKNPKEITFVIDRDNIIKEIDDKNNIVKIKL